MRTKDGETKMEKQEELNLLEATEEYNTLADLSSSFIKNPKVGEKISFVCKGFKIVKNKEDLEFSFEKLGKSKTVSRALSNVDYGIQLITKDNSVYWVNSWSVWGQIKGIAKKLNNNTLAGIEFEINHCANGMLEENKDKAWIVSAMVNGKFMKLNKESNNWE